MNRAWRTESTVVELNEECIKFPQDHEERIFWAAVFCAFAWIITVLWSNALSWSKQAGEIEDQYEEIRKQAVEHDERFS